MTATWTVLVVEDDDDLAEMLNEALQSEGYVVKTAANGHDALAILAAWRPHLIVLDLAMPVLDGWAFREAQRTMPQLADIPVVIFTAVSGQSGQLTGLDAAGVVTKPCDLDVLFTAVGRAVRAAVA